MLLFPSDPLLLFPSDPLLLDKRVGKFGARRHLSPCDFALDDARGIAVLSSCGSELQAVGGTGIRAAFAQRLLFCLGEGESFGGGGKVGSSVGDGDTDAGSFWGGRVAVDCF